MNSKDYLDLLMYNQKKVKDGFKFLNLKTKEQATIEDCYENIKKDLEILEILKKHIEINEYTYDEKDQNCIDMLIPQSDECFIKIKEWLEDESR